MPAWIGSGSFVKSSTTFDAAVTSGTNASVICANDTANGMEWFNSSAPALANAVSPGAAALISFVPKSATITASWPNACPAGAAAL
ncbi:hypothetical protein QP226_09590, partial [Aerococcus urinae]|uniref:hypothetical protein n=1 Tax=Aerococcus urinae TaxID=1376 RepID=UPI00254AB329